MQYSALKWFHVGENNHFRADVEIESGSWRNHPGVQLLQLRLRFGHQMEFRMM
jgi:hypothetical protein